MKLRDIVIIAGIGGIFVVYQLQKSREATMARINAARAPKPGTQAPPPVANMVEVVAPKPAAAPPVEVRDDADIRMRVNDGAKGTYIKDMLAADPMLMRWAVRRLEPLKVWIQRQAEVQNWNPQYPVMVERAFDQWHDAGFPIVFEFQPDSAGAEIKIHWATKLVGGDRAIGQARKKRDQNGWIVGADIEIATFSQRGTALTPETVGGVARHEIGHALGLGHSSDPNDVMYPESTTSTISAADRLTLHLLYLLPPGVVR